jgi:tRNA pseudouridine38-40 synthase
VAERIRIALGVTYNGQNYDGWQSQPSGNTIQDKLEAALTQFSTEKIGTLCAGRTDAGVHGLMQVVHFDTTIKRTPNSWIRGTNTYLPKDIAVQWAQEMPPSFHCRASAVSRRYAYILLESPVRPSIETGRVGWIFRPLDEQAMQEAAKYLIGEHDFSSFRAAACQALSPVKEIRQISIYRRSSREGSAYWRFEFEANAFLHHMIRNIMGCLLWVGQGLKPAEWMMEVLSARHRDAAAPTFSPDGLYFLGPQYDAQWGLPSTVPAYDWLP